MVEPIARAGDWVVRPSGVGYVLGRVKGRKLTRRTYYAGGVKGEQGALVAMVRAFRREKGAHMSEAAAKALDALEDAFGQQIELPGFEIEDRARREAFELMESSDIRRKYLERIRAEMRRHARRFDGTATPDDARRAFEAMDPPPVALLSRNFLALVFQTPEWTPTGRTYRSQTKGSHGNRLNVYRYTGERGG